ncbi:MULTISPECIES: hypothetical protein [unclassified Streptomyces]|uniref:hypothetical protein n=1 Tax=unclassified Streptomyces TaxID=2593676 RepID=UPI0019615FE0|nr:MULTISPECIES: hypothetical protein [unclassified Streptomyces]
MSAQAATAADASPSPWPTVVRAVALLTVTISLLLTAFAWPSVRSSVHDGAIDLSSGTPQIITASAGSTAVAQTLNTLATGLSQAQGSGTAVAARGLVPLPADDPRGAGLAAGALPLVMGGLLAVLLLTRLVHGSVHRVTGALSFALTIAATSLTVMGLESLLGYTGFGLGAAAMMLMGNPLSGTATAPEMLPGWSGALGQLLPPGAGVRLLRSTAFFDSHGASAAATVLATWFALGTVRCLAGSLRRRSTATAADPAARPAQLPTARGVRATGNGAS